LNDWSPFWSREPNAGRAVLDSNVVHAGKAALRIEHRAQDDWCVNSETRIPAQAGDRFLLEGWLKTDGPGEATVCVTTYDRQDQVVDWAYGARSIHGKLDWRKLGSPFLIPPGVAAIRPRIIGRGAGTAWVDELSLQKQGSIADLRRKDLPAELTISNKSIIVTLRTEDGTLQVRDQRTRQVWKQTAISPEVFIRNAASEGGLQMDLVLLPSGQFLQAAVELDPVAPEFTVTLSGTLPLDGPVKFPPPFVSDAGSYLVVPMNEGISYPVEDTSISPLRLVAFGGHGICMAFWGVTDGERGQMAIIETPDDALIRIDRTDGRLYVAPEWDPQKGQFGYARRLRYVFFDRGGHVAMCKRYRAYAQKTGLLKTLTQKRAEIPSVDRLIGAVNVWCWDRDAVPLVREMQAAGIERILWSNRQSPESLRALNDLGVLTSRYDIYQDVMNPENFKHLRGVHSDWTTAAWPQDIITRYDGDWLRGWQVKGTNGQWYPCGVICDKRAPDYAARRVPPELQTHPYRCRFIDTTTAAPWHECYDPSHPMTRTESREWKMKLLDYVSRDLKLVTGCETGHDAAVPYLHYFEGMLSLGPYRVPDAGRDMARIWDEVPERVAKFQLGHRYRLPLWELVYHDCVVAQWYWGDYNNKLPALWDKRDLFNALYGTPPMFMFNRSLWENNKARFVQSYKATCPIARATGYSEMTDHRFLTPDRDVQQTKFANDVSVTVNFRREATRLPDGSQLPAMSLRTQGLSR